MKDDVAETQAALKRSKECYNAISVPLQGAFEEVAKQITDFESISTLLATAAIIFQEALVIAARHFSPIKDEQAGIANRYFNTSIATISRDISEAISFDFPAPSHAEPK